MAKLFVFGIGGTGARVLKSLALLLASGVSIGKHIDEIVPIIIDPDKGNYDLTRTIEILETYAKLHQQVATTTDYKGFFQTKITNLYPTNGSEFRLMIQNVQGKTFGNYIDESTLTGNNKGLVDLLFSGTHSVDGTATPLLKMDMKLGFQGNPKLGCVVLNQFVGNADFNTFATNFTTGDRIFIISSIHGGTGAAGFPLLLKNLRTAALPTPNGGLLNNALIGATTVLPYYALAGGDIKSEDFVSKAKAALQYYVKNVNPSLNALYYIGNKSNTNNYKNNPGGVKQKNPAHFVELAAALSVIDFAEKDATKLSVQGNNFLEFGVHNFSKTIDFTSLGDNSKRMIQQAMSQYHLFQMYLDSQLDKSVDKQPWSNKGAVKLPKNFFASADGFMSALKSFNTRYAEWCEELASNDPSFTPFDTKASLLHSINGVEPKDIPWFKKDFVLFDAYLNDLENSIGNISQERKFIELFNQATAKLTTKHLF